MQQTDIPTSMTRTVTCWRMKWRAPPLILLAG